MKLGEARKIIGSLGFPSKMPGTSYGLPAVSCIAGAELAKITGSICHDCYALRDRGTWPNPQKAQFRRLEAINHPLWIDAMVRVLNHIHGKPAIRCDLGNTGQRLRRTGGQRWRWNAPKFHRWHDTGDLQSVAHFEKIVEVCWRTPTIRHWLPTREVAVLRRFYGMMPNNLIVRVSATMIDGKPPSGWAFTSGVHSDQAPSDAWVCPAPHQGNACVDCRACWSKDIAHVSYHFH